MNMNIKEPSGLAVSFFKQQADLGLLDLTPRYQRNVVWPASSQAYLIDTMLKRLPIPPIFVEKTTTAEGITRYAIVDGKQRLESIFRFINGNLTLPKEMSPTGAEAKFQDLPEDRRTALFSYRVSAIELEDATSSAVRDMFNRLNRNVARLTHQELRHAIYYDKPIYLLLERLAAYSFWDENSFFPRSIANRMGDMEYISQLVFVIVTNGPLAGEKNAIDRQYTAFDQQQHDLRAIERRFRRILRLVAELLPDLKSTRFKKAADFYGLFVALVETESDYIAQNKQAMGAALVSFGEAVDQFAEGQAANPPDATTLRYHSSVVEGPSKIKKRRDRADIIESILIPHMRQRDPRRLFTDVERRIIWSSDEKHICHICGRSVRQYDQYEPDHLEPHAAGGRTKIENARIAHRECNRRRRATPAPVDSARALRSR